MQFHPLTVARIDRPTDDSAAVTLEVPSALRPTFHYTPGQHLTFRRADPDGRGGELRRTYSVCSPVTDPAGPHTLTVGVRHIPGGAFSTHVVKELAVGDTVETLAPTGRFVLRPVPGHHVAVTGGSGITPVLAMAATLLATDPVARFTLLRAERSTTSAMFLEETADLKDRYPDRFQLVYALSREERQTGLAAGRLDAERLRALLPALCGTAPSSSGGAPTDSRGATAPGGSPGVGDVVAWYLCGPHGLVDAARTALRNLGASRARVHTELFHAAGDGPEAGRVADEARTGTAADGATVTATLNGRSGTWSVPDGDTLLEAVLRHRSDAPYACKGGVCGTCRTRLVSGEVRMDRNFALETEEVSAGYVLACQSRPLTPEVEVDFDG